MRKVLHVTQTPSILDIRIFFESATFSFRIQIFPRPHVIGFVAELLFPNLELSGFKNIRSRRMRVDGSRIRKEKVVDSKIAGTVDGDSLDNAGRLGYTK